MRFPSKEIVERLRKKNIRQEQRVGTDKNG